MNMKEVISIKYGRNTIAWTKIIHQVQDLLGAKIHTSYKILSTFQGHRNPHVQNIWNLIFFIWKDKVI